MLRSLRSLDALELSARDEHLHMISIFGSAAALSDASLLRGLRLERVHMAKLVAMARLAKKQFQRVERQVRLRVKRRSRALWRVVRMHVVLRSVAWWWYEEPSRSTRFEAERSKAIGEYETACGNKRFWYYSTEEVSPFAKKRPAHGFQPSSDSSPELAGRCLPSATSRLVLTDSHHTHNALRFPTCFPDALHGKS